MTTTPTLSVEEMCAEIDRRYRPLTDRPPVDYSREPIGSWPQGALAREMGRLLLSTSARLKVAEEALEASDRALLFAAGPWRRDEDEAIAAARARREKGK